MSNPTKRKALTNFPTMEKAVQFAEKNGNVAFERGGSFFTCTRAYVCDCLNAGQAVNVLADCETE